MINSIRAGRGLRRFLTSPVASNPSHVRFASSENLLFNMDVPPAEPQDGEYAGCGPYWVFLGSPGVGKGTYASRLAKLMDVPHIAMGDLVRQELKDSSPDSAKLSSAMTQGKLLPDRVILELLSKRLEHGIRIGEKGFILDGIPRTLIQAKVIEDACEIDMAVNLKLREDVLIAKCLGRRICSQCGGNFNLSKIDIPATDARPGIYMPALLPPPACVDKMTIRADDTEEVVKARLRIYKEESAPVEDFFRGKGKLLDFNVSGGISETWPSLLSALNIDEEKETVERSKKTVSVATGVCP